MTSGPATSSVVIVRRSLRGDNLSFLHSSPKVVSPRCRMSPTPPQRLPLSFSFPLRSPLHRPKEKNDQRASDIFSRHCQALVARRQSLIPPFFAQGCFSSLPDVADSPATASPTLFLRAGLRRRNAASV